MERGEMDPKRIVARGYDRIAERYAAWSGHGGDEPRDRYLALLEARLEAGAAVLELGCGTGALTTARLAARFAVTGVDISGRSIGLARRAVPGATFRHADMTALDLLPASFDAVTAFYSITHVPREEHAALLRAIARWLRPGGLLIATMGAGSTAGDVEEDWLGAPMYFSHYDAATNERLVREAGLRPISARIETTDEDGAAVSFLWVVAEKPRSGDDHAVWTMSAQSSRVDAQMKGVGTVEHVAQPSRARTRTINIRASQRQRDRIDQAAQALGKSRSEFMLETAYREAEDVLLDRRYFQLDRQAFERFNALLDSPPPPTAGLRRLLLRQAPWE